VVESLKCIVCVLHMTFIIGDIGIAGNEDFPLDAPESIGDNGDGCRLFVFAHDSRKGFVLLAYYSIEAFGPSKIFSQVSPDVQGFLWAWGSGCSNVWSGRWGSRSSIVSRLAMWFVVGCVGELLAHFLEFGSNAR
jgi:hypothetical protein